MDRQNPFEVFGDISLKFSVIRFEVFTDTLHQPFYPWEITILLDTIIEYFIIKI